jgi:hypothetical protein
VRAIFDQNQQARRAHEDAAMTVAPTVDLAAALASDAANAAAPVVTSANYANGTLQVVWTLTTIPFLTGFVVTLYDVGGTMLRNYQAAATDRTLSEAVTLSSALSYMVIVTAMQANLPGPSSQPFPVTMG